MILYGRNKMRKMPNIKLVSDLRNSTELLDESAKLCTTLKFIALLEEGEKSATNKGWISAEVVEAGLGI